MSLWNYGREYSKMNSLRNKIYKYIGAQSTPVSASRIADALTVDIGKINSELANMCDENIITMSFEDEWVFDTNNDIVADELDDELTQNETGIEDCEDSFVERFCSIENNESKNAFEDYLDENGKLDAVIVAQLFAGDVLFFNTPFERNGDNLTALSPQFNLPKMSEHPCIVQNVRAFAAALSDLMLELDADKDLTLPKETVHGTILRVLQDDRLTGLSFMNLLADHMIKIKRNEDESEYLIYVDRNILAGIPDAYHYICKFLKFAHRYNQKTGPFVVEFASYINFDGSIVGSLIPVSGAADARSYYKCLVDENGNILGDFCGHPSAANDNKDNEEKKISASGESEVSNAELESALEQDVVEGIQRYVREAVGAYRRIPLELAAVSFDDLMDTEAVVDKILNTLSIGASVHWLSNTLEIVYWKNAVHSDSGQIDALTYGIYIRFENGFFEDGFFDPNKIPNDIITAIEKLTEADVYTHLLKNAVMAQNRGIALVAPNSLKSKILELESHGEIEVSGTQYEGRSERIEKVKLGDKLELVREPNNIYDNNAILLQNKYGSLGHLPSYIAEILAPLLDREEVICTAIVSEVVPLSKRSGRSRKAILKVRLSYTILK